jgi:hypothetical protein
MASVKTPFGTETVSGRIRMIRRALNEHGTKELPWPEFAVFAGVPLGTAKHWEDRGQIGADSADALAARLTKAGKPCSGQWIRKGKEPTPEWAVAVSQDPARVAASHIAEAPVNDYLAQAPLVRTRPNDAGVKPGELLKLAAEAKRIAEALGEDLAHSEAPVLFDGTTEKGRQQALVWALKTLARDLHVLGFDMRRMFHITDELAAAIGLPAQQQHTCGGALPTGANFCPRCGKAVE